MVIKLKDDIQPAIAALERVASQPGLSKVQKEQIEDEIICIRSGAKGEREAAYHIDFEFQDSKRWMILHDLRIEHKGRVAQIDHVIINRHLDVFVIESKNFSTSVRINSEGEFEVKTRWGWKGMPSPVEQNNRHAEVLKSLLSDEALIPKRLGLTMEPNIYKWVLVAPECQIRGRKSEHSILKMDMFGAKMKKFREQDVTLREMMKIVSEETLREISQKLASYHKPITFDYAAKYGVTLQETPDEYNKYRPPVVPVSTPPPLPMASIPPPLPVAITPPSSPCCETCQASVEEKTVTYCRLNKKRFGGKVLCRSCQSQTASQATCDECQTPVDSKVVAFCRFNSRAFGKRTLCRGCQGSLKAVGVS